MKKVGLSLSGGGIRGAAHIGVLKSLEKHDVKIDMIAGNSAASIVAALYAIGYKPYEIEQIFLEYQNNLFKRLKFFDLDILKCFSGILHIVIKPFPNLDGFFKGDALEREMRLLCEKKGITKLSGTKIPIAIPSVDMKTADIIMFVSRKTGLAKQKDLVYYNNIEIWKAVRSSVSLPVIFKPNAIDNMKLVDGAIRQNLPCRILHEMGADVTIAVGVGYWGQDKDSVSGIMQIASRSMDIMSYQLVEPCSELVDLMVFPEVFQVKMLDFKKIQYCIDCGEKETDKHMRRIMKLIDR